MRAGKRVPKALVVLAAITIVLLAMLVWFLYALPAQMDAAAKQREERLVANGLSAAMEETARYAIPETNWDDGVAYLDRHFSADWAEENIGQYFATIHALEYSAVYDADMQPLYLSDHGKVVEPNLARRFTPVLNPLVRDVKRRELARPALQASHDGTMIALPIQSFGLAKIEGQLFILTATLVQPDFGRVMPSVRAPIVMTAKEVDRKFTLALARRFLLRDVELQIGESREKPGKAHSVLTDNKGRALGAVYWSPQEPGKALRAQLTPLAVFILVVILVVGLLSYRRLLEGAMELIDSEARAVYIASHDALTGLYERVYFLDRCSEAFENYRLSGKPFAVLAINIDGMKEMNERLGHARGDELLRGLAARIQQACGEDYIIARFGGDEFAVLALHASPSDASILAQSLIKAVAAPIDLSCGAVAATCCIGVCVSGAEAQTFQDCLNNLEFAMRIAKAEGQGKHSLFSPALAQAQKKRSALLRDLKRDLAENALSVVYQPQGDLNGQVVGVESLVRWTHAEHGPIAPDLFVALAEESDLINELGYFVMRQAFEDSENWPGLKIAINVSARQLYMPGFMKRVNEMLVETRVDPSRFELEITERLIMTDDQLTYDVLHELNDYGFSIALDDFGAGYSNLSYLCRFPIEKIKIDKEFVDGLGIDPDAEMLVGAIVQLAYAMRLNVIAEGVETPAQRALLAAAGCTTIQGYLFSRPLTPDQLTEFLSASLAPSADSARLAG